MSVRFGVLLIPSPSFTARAYRARRLICGQYGAWAAEMHMLHLTVAAFFECSEAALSRVDAGLTAIAEQSRRRDSRFPLNNRGVAGGDGGIFLDLSGRPGPEPLQRLHMEVVGLLGETSGATLGMEHTGSAYRPHIPLMQYADLPTDVMADALDFAGGVVYDLALPESTTAWRLLLVRFRSQAAGEDWSGGRWAADLSWDIVSSYYL